MVLKDNIISFEYKNKIIKVPLAEPWSCSETLDLVTSDESISINEDREFFSYLTIHVTNKCNLNCDYCFEKEKPTKSFDLSKTESLFKLIKRLNKNRKLEIRIFGGEPTIELQLIKNFLNKLLEMNESLDDKIEFSYNIFTNGTILNQELISLIKRFNMQVFMSIDCNKEIHDLHRIDKNNNGTYDKVIENAKKLNLELEDKISIRSVIDPNLKKWSLIDYCDNFYKDGFYLYSIEFPWASCDSKFSLNIENLETIKKEIHNYCDEYIKRIKNNDYSLIGLHPFGKYIALALNNTPIVELYACGAGYSGFSISPEGKIYPCHGFVDYEEFCLGNIEEGITNQVLLNDFENYSADSLNKCKNCAVRYLCMKRCPYDAFLYSNDIKYNSDFRCLVQKEIIKASFYLISEIKKMRTQERVIRKLTKTLLLNKVNKHA